MTQTDDISSGGPSGAEVNARIVVMRDSGIAWVEIQRRFGLTRQQARYAYQLGKRAERRGRRPST